MRSLALLLLLGLTGSTWAQVGISPSYHDLSLDEASKTQTFRMFNYTTEAKRVKVSLASWDADANNQPRLLPPGGTTLDQWVVVNPVEFTVKPQASQAVRFSVRPAVELTPGEHRVMLIFDEIAPPAEGGKLRARFQFRSAVYVQVGTVTRKGEILAISADAKGGAIRLKNVGSANVRFDGQYSVWQAARFPGESATGLILAKGNEKPALAVGQILNQPIAGLPVLPGDTHAIAVGFGDSPLKPGRYVLDLNGKLGDAQLDQSQEFTVAEPRH